MKLDEYIEDQGIAIARFAKRCNLTYPQVRHILIGNVPTLESALRIQKYTKGEVSPEELLTDKLRKEIYGENEKKDSE